MPTATPSTPKAGRASSSVPPDSPGKAGKVPGGQYKIEVSWSRDRNLLAVLMMLTRFYMCISDPESRPI
jgi:hypothetical protein